MMSRSYIRFVWAALWLVAMWMAVQTTQAQESATETKANPVGELVARITKAVGDDKPFSLIVRLKLKPEAIESFIAAAKEGAAESRKEAGCLLYDFHQNQEDPTEVIVLENWKDVAALKLHLASPHFAKLGAAVGPAVVEPMQVRITKLVTPIQ